jgi:hypothetical protein
MTSTFDIYLTAKTAPRAGADFGVRADGVGSAGHAMWAPAQTRAMIVETSRNLDALAARGAG